MANEKLKPCKCGEGRLFLTTLGGFVHLSCDNCARSVVVDMSASSNLCEVWNDSESAGECAADGGAEAEMGLLLSRNVELSDRVAELTKMLKRREDEIERLKKDFRA